MTREALHAILWVVIGLEAAITVALYWKRAGQ
jgi:hypothetical protein